MSFTLGYSVFNPHHSSFWVVYPLKWCWMFITDPQYTVLRNSENVFSSLFPLIILELVELTEISF